MVTFSRKEEQEYVIIANFDNLDIMSEQEYKRLSNEFYTHYCLKENLSTYEIAEKWVEFIKSIIESNDDEMQEILYGDYTREFIDDLDFSKRSDTGYVKSMSTVYSKLWKAIVRYGDNAGSSYSVIRGKTKEDAKLRAEKLKKLTHDAPRKKAYRIDDIIFITQDNKKISDFLTLSEEK